MLIAGPTREMGVMMTFTPSRWAGGIDHRAAFVDTAPQWRYIRSTIRARRHCHGTDVCLFQFARALDKDMVGAVDEHFRYRIVVQQRLQWPIAQDVEHQVQILLRLRRLSGKPNSAVVSLKYRSTTRRTSAVSLRVTPGLSSPAAAGCGHAWPLTLLAPRSPVERACRVPGSVLGGCLPLPLTCALSYFTQIGLYSAQGTLLMLTLSGRRGP